MTIANDPVLLDRLTTALGAVRGVSAIVLGGSRARGLATDASDYDIGLYYEPTTPLDVAALRAVVATLDDRGPAAEVTEIGGWGPWINGGGWLTISGKQVDLLYRDLGRVREVIEQCRGGNVIALYQVGHPHAFVTAIYAGEIATCMPLRDMQGVLQQLKALVLPYPAPLQQALTKKFIWEAQFAIDNARHGRGVDDVNYVSGCCFRSIASLCQVLFALNDEYLLNEKGAVTATDRLARRPNDFARRVEAVFGHVGSGARSEALELLQGLVRDTEGLVKIA